MGNTKQPTSKSSKTVEVKLLVPYAILTIFLAVCVGFYFGWTERSENIGEVQREAHILVEGLKVSE